jgi:hypothetical protein
MGKILCTMRGGEASRRTQDAAIALAQERGDELAFLYVVDVAFPSGGRQAALESLRAFAAEIEAETAAQVYIP